LFVDGATRQVGYAIRYRVVGAIEHGYHFSRTSFRHGVVTPATLNSSI
jgi:hypothetical protein